jgi:hypothetical protein
MTDPLTDRLAEALRSLTNALDEHLRSRMDAVPHFSCRLCSDNVKNSRDALRAYDERKAADGKATT